MRNREKRAPRRIPEKYLVTLTQGERLAIMILCGNHVVEVLPIPKTMMARIFKSIDLYEKGGKK